MLVTTDQTSATSPRRLRACARWLWRGASVLVFVLMLDYVVLPQLAGTERSLHLLRSANLWLLVAAVTSEATSLRPAAPKRGEGSLAPSKQYAEWTPDAVVVGSAQQRPPTPLAGPLLRRRVDELAMVVVRGDV